MPEEGSDFEKILVPTLTLDDILAAHKPTVIFCDIEGAELSYFRSKMFYESIKSLLNYIQKSMEVRV